MSRFATIVYPSEEPDARVVIREFASMALHPPRFGEVLCRIQPSGVGARMETG